MISDKLYKLAFEYKKKKLWKKLWDTDMFAVRLSEDRIGYISIMGAAGEYCAVALYIGDSGFKSYSSIMTSPEKGSSPFEFHEKISGQECLQCAFVNKDELTEDEYDEVRKYISKNKIRIGGKNAYPQFVKHKCHCIPWDFQTEKESEDMAEALSAAIEVANIFERSGRSSLKITGLEQNPKELVLLERKNEGYELSKTKLPSISEEVYPSPRAGNDISMARIKMLRVSGIWECKLLRAPEPTFEEEGSIPYFPIIVVVLNITEGIALPLSAAVDYEEKPEVLMNRFIDMVLQEKSRPMEIRVSDKRSYMFFKNFCERLSIKLTLKEELDDIREMEEDLWNHLTGGEFDEFDEFPSEMNVPPELLVLGEDELMLLPDHLIGALGNLVGHDIFPDFFEKKLKKVMDRKTTAKKEKSKYDKPAEGSYIISVSLGTGCYRHIKIASDSTLERLHSAILDAFGFDDDHAHAFFMDNISWSSIDCYYMKGVEDSHRTTDNYRLDEVGLEKGSKFKFVFDFGDEWTFQCKLLKITDDVVSEPEIIRLKGEAPSQY